jgi:PhnB protein
VTSKDERHAPAPDGYSTVTPWIIARDSRGLIQFLVEAFDAEQIGVVELPNGTVGHAEVRIGDSVMMMFDSLPEWPDTPAFLRLYVEDAEASHARALSAGATSVSRVTEVSWGDRIGRLRDPHGNVWWIQQHGPALSPEEIGRRAAEPRFIEAMEYLQNAQIVQ